MPALAVNGRICPGWTMSLARRSLTPVLLAIVAATTLIAGVRPLAAQSPPIAADRLPRDNLLLYRDQQGRPRKAESVDDWKKRRKEILTGMKSIMGALPGDEKKVPLDVKVESEDDCGSYVRRLITYRSEPGVRTPAYLCLPKSVLQGDGTQAPAVLCLHPTDNRIGHKVVVGLGGRANRQYAAELAERGYVTLAPSYPLLANYQPDVIKLGWESGTLKAVWDNIRGIDFLMSMPEVQGDSVGAIGHSLGGHNAVYTAAFDERIAVVVSSCGLDSYLDYYDGAERVWMPEKGWTQTRYMPKLRNYRGRLEEIPFDFHEILGVLAPRSALIIAPKGDGNFRYKSVDRVVEAASDVYALYGHPDRLKTLHPDCDHDFPEAMRAAAYRWIDDVLKR